MARLDGLQDQDALQHAAIDQRNTEKALVSVFSCFAKIFETRMFLCVREGKRPHLFGNQSGEAFTERHAQCADALRPEATRCGEHEICAVWLEQINRADIGLESARDQCHHIAESFCRLATVFCQISNFFQRQNVLRVARINRLAQSRLPHVLQVEDTSSANKMCRSG